MSSDKKSAPEIQDPESIDEETINLDEIDQPIADDELVIDDDTELSDEETELQDADTKKTDKKTAKTDLAKSETLDDPAIDSAINDIVAEEADTVLNAEDEARQAEIQAPLPQKNDNKFVAFIKSIWKNPKYRWSFIALVLLTFATLAAVPTTRYFILNTARIRASVEVKVIDSNTMQPLKNVSVKVANSEAKTDIHGVAKLSGVLLGQTQLKIEKRAFEVQQKKITVGWGSNPLGEFRAKAVGAQYVFHVNDFLNGKPLEKVEASSGDGNAVSDQDGKIVLVMDTAELDDSDQLNVSISASDYRTEQINIAVSNREAQKVDMVPSKKHTFVSKRSGKYDVYTIDVDGKNERKIVDGTGFERDDITLVPHPNKDFVAYAATRENVRNQTGYLLSTLYIVDTRSGDIVKIDQSEQVQVIGWTNSGRLVYVMIASGASGVDPKRHRLVSFNNDDLSDTKELAASNSFNDVLMFEDTVYYAPSNVFNESSNPAMYSIKADGKDQKTILDKEVHSIVRTGYDSTYLVAGNEWYSYTLGSPMAASSTPPSSQTRRQYVDNTTNKFSLWVDERDGKGVLISYDKTTSHELTLEEKGGLKHPVYWLDSNNVVYRVADGRETADYIISTNGGEPHKITDTTDTGGVSGWYYF